MLRIGVAALITLCGLSGCDGGGSSLPAVEAPTSPRLDLVATEMRFTPAEIAVPAGSFEVVLRNHGLVRHDLRIEGRPQLLIEAGPGQTATARWDLPPGRYRTYCSIPGHRPAGMEGLLEVR
jgi:plastocyanin